MISPYVDIFFFLCRLRRRRIFMYVCISLLWIRILQSCCYCRRFDDVYREIFLSFQFLLLQSCGQVCCSLSSFFRFNSYTFSLSLSFSSLPFLFCCNPLCIDEMYAIWRVFFFFQRRSKSINEIRFNQYD